jgi:hypothetical protein
MGAILCKPAAKVLTSWRHAASVLFRRRLLAGRVAICYIVTMTQAAKEILRRVESWPQEDQDELAELAREIEARRTGVYALSDEERAALDDALRSGVASDEEVAAFWKRHGIA